MNYSIDILLRFIYQKNTLSDKTIEQLTTQLKNDEELNEELRDLIKTQKQKRFTNYQEHRKWLNHLMKETTLALPKALLQAVKSKLKQSFTSNSVYKLQVRKSNFFSEDSMPLNIISPKNEVECIDYLEIVLETPLSFEINITIEDNRNQVVFSGNFIPPNTKQYTINILDLNLPAGRYYCKLTPPFNSNYDDEKICFFFEKYKLLF